MEPDFYWESGTVETEFRFDNVQLSAVNSTVKSEDVIKYYEEYPILKQIIEMGFLIFTLSWRNSGLSIFFRQGEIIHMIANLKPLFEEFGIDFNEFIETTRKMINKGNPITDEQIAHLNTVGVAEIGQTKLKDELEAMSLFIRFIGIDFIKGQKPDKLKIYYTTRRGLYTLLES